MSLIEKIYFTVFSLIFVMAVIYWGNLSWFHSDKLKQMLMEKAKRNPDWLFMKGYSLKFSDKYGIWMMRLITLFCVLLILISSILFVLGRLK